MNKLFPQQSDHPLFRYFTDPERERIESIGEMKRIAKGGFLIRASEVDSTLFAVEEGHLDIVGMDNGKPTVLAGRMRRGKCCLPLPHERECPHVRGNLRYRDDALLSAFV